MDMWHHNFHVCHVINVRAISSLLRLNVNNSDTLHDVKMGIDGVVRYVNTKYA